MPIVFHTSPLIFSASCVDIVVLPIVGLLAPLLELVESVKFTLESGVFLPELVSAKAPMGWATNVGLSSFS